MISNIDKYNTWIFDFDGVIVDSNKIKTNIFEKVLRNFDPKHVEQFLIFHKENGGMPRQEKIQYFEKEIINRPIDNSEKKAILEEFQEEWLKELMSLKLVPQIYELLLYLKKKKKDLYIISGGRAEEINLYLEKIGIIKDFRGVYGGPISKIDHLKYLETKKELISPTIFVGDSKTDYESALAFELDFIFATKYSAFDEWKTYFNDKNDVLIVSDMSDVMAMTTIEI